MQAKISASGIKSITPKETPFEVVDRDLKGFLLRVQPTGRMTYYFSYRTKEGKRKRVKIGVHGPQMTPQQGRDEAIKLAGSVAGGVDVQQEKSDNRRKAQEANERTLKAFIENQYQPWVLANRKTGQETLSRVESCFDEFMSLSMGDITVRRVERWRTEQLKRGLKSATINRSVICLRGIISKAVECGMLEQHPLEKLKPLAVDKLPKVRFLSNEEELRLDDALKQRDRELKSTRERGNQHRRKRGYPLLPCLMDKMFADRMTPLVTLSLKTGMRKGESFDLQWQDVDLPNKVITVQGDTAKSGHTRHIPLGPTALKVLQCWAAQSGPCRGRVFPADDGGRLDNTRKSWAAILKAADIKQFRWHDMRHDFASKLVMKGVPLNTVRELCGHADHNTTLRYAHLAPDHKADAVALIG